MPTATSNADVNVVIDPTGSWEPGETREVSDDHAAVLVRSHLFTVKGYDGDPNERSRAQGTPETAPASPPEAIAPAAAPTTPRAPRKRATKAKRAAVQSPAPAVTAVSSQSSGTPETPTA
ncbi:MAG: hypothetical protein ACRENL_11405 [Candidatus Dormibacteria bacterium]